MLMLLKFCSRAMTSQIRHLAKAAKPTPCYKYVRPVTSATKDCFINNLPDQFHHLSIPDSSEELHMVTETFNSLFSSTLDACCSVVLKEDYTHTHTHTQPLKSAVRTMERNWKKTKLEVFHSQRYY